MDLELTSYIFNAGLFVLVSYGGIKWNQAKNVLRETAELLLSIATALDDDQVTEDEQRVIINDALEVVLAVKSLKKD